MKHLQKGRKFGREKKQREAMLKIMLGELFGRGKISTTEAKGKEIKMIAEKMLSKIKRYLNSEQKLAPSQIRIIKASLPVNITVKRILELSGMIASRSSGFLRLTKTGNRLSDGAKMAIVEIISD